MIPLQRFQVILHFLVPSFVSVAQETDSTSAQPRFAEGVKKHTVEVGLIPFGAGLEYHYEIIPFISTDCVLAAGPPGIAFGLSFVPLTYVFAQGVYGISSYQEVAAVDGPTEFRPDYAYAWRAGVHVPLDPRKGSFFLSISGGDVWLVQKEYCSNCGGFFTGPTQTPEYKKEVRHFQAYGFGLVYKF